MQVFHDFAIDNRDALARGLGFVKSRNLAAGKVEIILGGRKTWLAMASWAGWISVLPSKPRSRPCSHSGAGPSVVLERVVDAIDDRDSVGARRDHAGLQRGHDFDAVGAMRAPSSFTRSLVPMTMPRKARDGRQFPSR